MVLPNVRDPRLHLAAVIVSLQVLGQVAFDFRLSIAQILISVVTCAVLEVAIVLKRQRALVWPASALLTGNGVAFILRVPGTEHGDWWSTNGWWIFAGTAAVSLLSKYVIRVRGAHVFNPSNFGLVLCFLVLGPELADPLDFWWGPLSPALVLALAIIIAGGFAILSRLHLLALALSFWTVFVGAMAVVAATGHAMTARWHPGPVEGLHFLTILAFSPEILVFVFFMLTDPRTVPAGQRERITFGRIGGAGRGTSGRSGTDRVLGQGRRPHRARARLRGARSRLDRAAGQGRSPGSSRARSGGSRRLRRCLGHDRREHASGCRRRCASGAKDDGDARCARRRRCLEGRRLETRPTDGDAHRSRPAATTSGRAPASRDALARGGVGSAPSHRWASRGQIARTDGGGCTLAKRVRDRARPRIGC